MKLMATVLTVCLLALNSVSTHAQAIQNSGEAFQVKKNVLITDTTGARFGEQNADDLKLWEDGNEQKITSISTNSGLLHLVIVIDDSGSMSSQRNHVSAVGKFIIQNLEPNALVRIVRFPGRGPGGMRIVNDWTSDKSRLVELIDQTRGAGGGSPIWDGVWTALDQVKEQKTLGEDKRYGVVLISDCMEGGSTHSLDELLQELSLTNVPLFTVMLTDQYERMNAKAPNSRTDEAMMYFEKFSHDAALVSGGSAYFPRKGENAKLPLAETLKDLTAELWSQFVVTYTPTNQMRDSKQRSLRIGAADGYDGTKRVARMKETYFVAQVR